MRRNHRMSRAAVSLAAVCASLVGYAALAQSTDMPAPDAVSMRVRQAHPEYVTERADLIAAVAAYNGKEASFKTACHGVDEDDTARIASCRSQQASLRAEKASLLARLRSFSADVNQASHAAECLPPTSRPQIGGATEIQGTVYIYLLEGKVK